MMKITLFVLAAMAVACAQETAPTAAEPEAPTAAEPEAPTAAEPEAPTAAEPAAPTAAEPAAPTAAEPAAPTAAKPIAYTAARPAPAASGQPEVTIVKQVDEVDVDKYNFEFETSDGTYRQETGEYKNDTEQEGLVVRGSYKYIAPDGQEISVTYVADKNGYQPTEVTGDKEKPAEQA